MTVRQSSLHEINQLALKTLLRELGVVNTLRFMRQFPVNYGNYTEERQAETDDLSLEQVIRSIKAQRKK